MDPALSALARQLGLIERGQALELGISPRTIARRLRAGAWERVQPRVYRSTDFPTSREQALLAAVLAGGPLAAVSHRAAAALWGVDRLRSAPIEVTVPTDHVPALSGAKAHPIADLVPGHVNRLGPIPLTNPARTLVDLGAVSRPWLVARTLEQWLRERKVRIEAIWAVLEEVSRKGRAGAGTLRAVLDERALGLAASDSPAEVELANALRSYGVPEPEYHHLVPVGHEVFELDFAYPAAKLAIEVDGYGPHSSREAFEEDRRRRNLIEGRDWRILAYTPARIRSRPWAVADEVGQNLSARLAAA